MTTDIGMLRAINWMVSTIAATVIMTEWPRVLRFFDRRWQKDMGAPLPTWMRRVGKWNAIIFGLFGFASFYIAWFSALHRKLPTSEAIAHLAPAGMLVLGGLVTVLLRGVYTRMFNAMLPPGETSKAAGPAIWTVMGWILMLAGHAIALFTFTAR